ncbi:hypothetical protein DI09_150p20 [Mitosporidium daphniae]|uniref:Acyltransferase 3 domain-containing protein n=1 Tax=Mitosporidium daphniae TaxID=1485682 RepID=A0A098VUI3_9MICR|nr:uncharacterized protein DI09_150p20 [Mitosporidium daphniae]KGG52615.1 hypothetical protein DI09_150p20 [Mitosporidium daphniae]|eukprot:XP_013239051.1 uncharacterized protein DI09_150p20 [Mitosporidium daphniae]
MKFPAKKSDSKKENHIKALAGLRGLCAIAVIYSHIKSDLFPTFNVVGHHAVIFFFFQSSFLVSYHLLMQWRKLVASMDLSSTSKLQILTKKVSARMWCNYALKRFFRIYPLFALVLIMIYFGPSFFDDSYGQIRDTSTIFQHLLLYKCRSLFWTIPFEIVFYFVAPLVVISYDFFVSFFRIFINRHFKSKMFFVFCILIISQILFCALVPEFYYPIPTFSLGCFTGFIWAEYHYAKKGLEPQYLDIVDNGSHKSQTKSEQRKKETGFRVFFDLFCYVNALIFYFSLDSDFPTRRAPFSWWKPRIFDSVMFSNITMAIVFFPGSFSRIFEWNFLQFAGKISYSLYLTHPMSLLISESIFSCIFSAKIVAPEEIHFNKSVLGIAISLAIGSFFHFIIEKPAINFGSKIMKA